jgi:hypothetical protein
VSNASGGGNQGIHPWVIAPVVALAAFKAFAVIFLMLLPFLLLVKAGSANPNARAGE